MGGDRQFLLVCKLPKVWLGPMVECWLLLARGCCYFQVVAERHLTTTALARMSSFAAPDPLKETSNQMKRPHTAVIKLQ